MMETVTDRITRYLLRRIRRLAVLDLYERAAVAGLLEGQFIDDSDEKAGTVWHVPASSLSLMTGDVDTARRTIAIQLKRVAPYTAAAGAHDPADGGENMGLTWVPENDAPNLRPRKPGRRRTRKLAAAVPAQVKSRAFLALLREHLPRPPVVHVAIALLVARAVGTSIPNLQPLRSVLRQPSPSVLIKVPTVGFERRFGLMLEDALIAPFWARLKDVYRSAPLSEEFADRRPDKRRREIATLSGRAAANIANKVLSRRISDILTGASVPLVIADETQSAPTPYVSLTADIVFECTGIDDVFMAELLHICCGIAPKHAFRRMQERGFDPHGIAIDDLALAVRPGRSLDGILAVLAALAQRTSKDDEDGGGERRSKDDRPGRVKVRTEFLKDERSRALDAGVEVVRPVADAAADGSALASDDGSELPIPAPVPVQRLRVEDLAGYGEARPWALDLKSDLELYRSGRLGWREMSTKLLLSGPPGTGKTTFARALCNSLQVPLLVTSVASWLEPGYLGDVLKRMAAAFDVARHHAPAILFIDEIDNIGMRMASRPQHDDYWVSLINRLLELLDGASKTEGVIVVGATNLPERIDPALLRSGRLEKHVAIPLPDFETLAGILAHHLGADLETVIASAPPGAQQNAGALPSTAEVDASSAPLDCPQPQENGAPKHG
jgi:cell division protease FtsH